MDPIHIDSPDNPLIKQLVRLADAGERRSQGRFLVEGLRAISGCLEAGWIPQHLLLRSDLPQPSGWPTPIRMSERVAKRLSHASTPSGYCACFPLPDPGPLDAAAGGLVLAGVADPGNLGTLIRSAAAFAVRQVVIAGGADPWGPKVVQSTAGALAAIRIHRCDGPAALAGGAPLCALVPRGGSDIRGLPRHTRWIVVGGEAAGVPDAWIAAAAERATLPMPGQVESLNAAIAGALALWELVGR